MSEHFILRSDAESDLLSCAAYLAESIPGGEAQAEAMLAVVPRYLEKGNVDLAAELANSIDDPFTRDRLLIMVAEKCAELDDDDYALQLVEAIEDTGFQAQAYERVALKKAAKSDFAKAREIAAGMQHPDGVFAGIAVKLARDGDDAAAMETLDEITFPSSSVSALLAIASFKISNGENENAVEVLQKTHAKIDEIEHDEERIRALCNAGNLFIEAGRNDLAVGIFEKGRVEAEALGNVHRDSFLAHVSLGFLHAGSIDLADRTLDAVADKTQIASVLLGFARDYWRKDEKEEAIEALEEGYAILKSQRDIETRDSKAKFALFTQFAAQFAGFEKGERAIEISEGIEEDEQKMSALLQIAQIATTQNNDELARQSLNAIPEVGNRVYALIGMSTAASENGENERAAGFLKEAVELSESVPQLALRSSAYNEIARRYHEIGSEKARSIAQLSLETIPTIRDEGSRVTALTDLATTYATTGLSVGDTEEEILRSLLTSNQV